VLLGRLGLALCLSVREGNDVFFHEKNPPEEGTGDTEGHNHLGEVDILLIICKSSEQDLREDGEQNGRSDHVEFPSAHVRFVQAVEYRDGGEEIGNPQLRPVLHDS
jgi:hypothetical protein